MEARTIAPFFFRNNPQRDRKKQNRIERALKSSRKFAVEQLEPRLLLSVDLLPEVGAALAAGIDQIGDRVESFLTNGDTLGDRVPILLKTLKDTDGSLVYEAPTIQDLLSVPVDANLDGEIDDSFWSGDEDEAALDALDTDNSDTVETDEFLRHWLFDPIVNYLNNLPALATTQDFVDFLEGSVLFNLDHTLTEFSTPFDVSGISEVKFRIVDAKVNDTTEDPNDAEVTFSLGFELSVTQNMPIDLGLQADALRILPFTGNVENGLTPKVPVTSKLTWAFDFGVFTGGQAPADIGASDFFVRKAEPLIASVKSDVGDIPDFNMNIGFLGAKVVDGSLLLQADIETALLDPNDPDLLGFTDAQLGVEQTSGSVTAANVPPSANLTHAVGFFLRIGNIGVTTPVSVVDNNRTLLSDLINDIDAGLVNAGLGNLIEVSLSGGKVKFDLVATTSTPLGFANEALGTGGTLSTTPDGDGGNIYEYTSDQNFLLSLAGALPKLVSVNFRDSSQTHIGLNNGQAAAPTSLVAPSAASVFDITGDATFTVTVFKDDGTNEALTFTVTATETDGNVNATDLAADIDGELFGSPLFPLVIVESDGTGHIRFRPLSGSVSAIRVVASGTAVSEIGFSGDATSTLELLAANAVVANLSDPAHFKISIKTAGPTTTVYSVTVADNNRATLGELAADINAAIDAVAPGRINVFESGGKILLKAVNSAVLDFSVITINENLADLLLDVNAALVKAGFSGQVSASDSGGLLALNSTGGKSLEITHTLTLDAGVTFSELQSASAAQLFDASEGAASKVQIKLPVDVLPGLEDATTGADDDFKPANVALVGNFNPYADTAATFDTTVNRFSLNFEFTPEPTVPEQDTPVGSVPSIGSLTEEVRLVNFAELLNFSLLTSEGMIGLLGGLGTALQQLSDNAEFASYGIPFADATLSDLLKFADSDKAKYAGLIDMLIYDTGGDGMGGGGTDHDKLLKKVTIGTTSYLLPSYSTAQTLATRLKEIMNVALSGAGGINATYDKVSNELTYQLDLHAESRTMVDQAVSFENDVPLDPFDKLEIDSSVPPPDTSVQLTGGTGLGMTFGVNLSPPGFLIFETTKLKELNAGEGVDIQRVKAVTGTKDIPIVPTTSDPPTPPPAAIPQLSADALFFIKVNGGPSIGVTVKASATVNQSMGDFVADVNNALVTAGLSNDIEADASGQRLVLKARSVSTNFEIFAVNIVAQNQIGLTAGTMATKGDFVVTTLDGLTHVVSLDSLTPDSTLQQLIAFLDGISTSFDADFNAIHTGLRLIDTSVALPNKDFRVNAINASKALLQLGFLVAGDEDSDMQNKFNDGDPRLIEGGGIGLTSLDERFFVRNAQIRIDGLTVKTPDDGVPGKGLYGIVGVDTNVNGILTTNVTANLMDVGGGGNRLTLAELLGRIELNYDGQSGGEFVIGGTVLGATAGDSAQIVDIKNDSGGGDTTGTLVLYNIKGKFTDNETLTQGSVHASADGSTVILANPVVSKPTELQYDNQLTGFPFTEFKVGGVLFTGDAGDYAVIVGIKADSGVLDSTGTLLLSDVKGTFSDNESIFQASPTVNAWAQASGTPGAGSNFGSFTLTVKVQPGFDDLGFDDDFDALDAAPYSIPFDLTGFGNPFTPTAPSTSALNLNLLNDLKPFDKLTYSNLATTLHGLLNVINGINTGFTQLNTILPAINRSVGQLLDLVEGFERAVDNADAVLNDAIFAIGPDGFGLPALRLQDVPRALRGAFGLPDGVDPAGAGAADFVKLDYDTAADELLLSLNLHNEISTKLGLDIVTGPGLPNLTSAGVLEVFGTLDVRLDVAISLATPSNVFLLDTTNIAGSLHVQGEGQEYAGGEDGLGLVFRSSLGPLAVFVQDGDVLIDFNFSLPGMNFGGGVHRKALGLVVFADFKPAEVTKNTIDIVLPMFYNGEGPSAFIGEYKAAGTVGSNVVTAPDFAPIAAAITAGTIPYDPFENILLAIDTLDVYLELLGDQIAQEILGIQLPFISDQMGDVLFIEDFRTTLIRTLKNGIENSVNPNPDTKITQLLQGLAVGSLAGYLNLGSIANTVNMGSPATSRSRQWNFTIAHTDIITIDDYDIGPDHLTFDIKTPVTVTFDWSIEIGFGVNFGEGAYIVVSDNDEVNMDLTIKTPNGLSATGELGFFRLLVTDPDNNSGAKVSFVVNVKNGSTSDALLGFADIGSLNPTATITGERLPGAVEAASYKIETTQTLGLPVLKSDFIFDWTLATTNVDALNGDAVTPGIQKIALNLMTLDAISGLKQLLGKPFEEIAKIIDPFMPVIDLLTAPIPILSDLAGEPFTLLDLAEIFGSVDADFLEAVADILDVIHEVGLLSGGLPLPLGSFTLYDIAAGPDYFNPADPSQPLGSGGDLVQGVTPGLASTPGAFDTAIATIPFLDKIHDQNLIDGLRMPIFEDPVKGINLFVNRDAELVKYDLPNLAVSFEYLQVFPIWGPLAVSIEISFGFGLDLHAVGFDTFGYRRFADGGFRNPALIFDGFFLDDEDVEGGPDAPEITFEFGLVGAAELNIGIARAGVGGGIDAVINFDWHDSIPDTNVHFSEILGNILAEGGNPLAMFDVSGELTFELFAFLEIELLGIDETFPITGPQTLFSFNESFARKPKLGTLDETTHTLYLNMGPNAMDRLNGDTSDGNEEFFVERVGSDVNLWSTKLGVGVAEKQTYHNVTHIIGLGGQGDDQIHLSGFDGSTITGDFDGGVGDDTIEFTDSAASTDGAGFKIVGGLGNDKLIGSHLNDTITGGEGNDTIKGNGGYDILFGDQGRVAATFITSRITDSDGDDNIDGGAADDVIFGDGGSDILHGGADFDLILGDGGRFDYTKTGAGLHVNIVALRPPAYVPTPVSTPKDPDIISAEIDALMDFVLNKVRSSDLGFGGNDKIFGDAGDDLAFGGSGDDTIEGNAGDDILLGGKGFDEIKGGDNKDSIFGGDQADTLSGNAGDDVMAGGAGNDFMHGNENNDVMKGDTGGDVMFGDAGDDQVFGQTEPDVLFGGVDDDLVVGGSSNDIMFGDDGLVAKLDPVTGLKVKAIGIGNLALLAGQFFDNDIRTLDLIITDVVAGDGNDMMSGDAGEDIMLGGGGNDLMGGDVDPRLPSFPHPSELSDDVEIGDGGRITFERRRFRSIETIIGAEPPVGGPFNDVIYGDNGNDYIFGGRGSDFLFGGHGKIVDVGTETVGASRGVTDAGARDNDIIVGDNGKMTFAGYTIAANFGRLELVQTTDTSDISGGHEYAEGELGSDVIFGGVNGSIDVLFGNAGSDVILGDNGELDFALGSDTNLDTLDLIRSYRDGLGGIDWISGNAGDDVLIGGTAGDLMYGDDAAASAASADGEDIMLGDNADIFLIGTVGRLKVQVAAMTTGTAVDLITTTDSIDLLDPDYDTIAEVDAVGGPDTMSGNAKADIILGGVNNGGVDTMYGDQATTTAASITNDGNDIMLGDNGLLDFSFGSDADLQTLDLIRSFEDGLGGTDVMSGNKGLDVAIGGTAGDTIYGDNASASAAASDLADLLLGDNADIFLVAKGGAAGGDLKDVLGSAVKTIRTTDEEHPEYGGIDTISGNAGGDIIAGGVAGDFLYGDRSAPNPTTSGNDGDDMILGDNGAFEWLSTGRLGEITGIDIAVNNAALYAKYNPGVADADLTTLDLITTEQPRSGGRDTIYGDEKNDLVFGGTDLDFIFGDDGDEAAEVATLNRDVLFGDHGRLYPQFSTLAGFNSRNFFAIDIGNNVLADPNGGEGDIMHGEEGDDVMLGQQGDDRMWGGSGNDDMIGGHNVSGGYDELGAAGAISAVLNPSMNDLMDGDSGNDAMAGDNAIIWRRGDDFNLRFRALAAGKTAIYATGPDDSFPIDTAPVITVNIGESMQSDPNDAVGRDIELVDHADNTPAGLFGADVMAGGSEGDVMYGQLANDLMQGDGSIDESADALPQFITRNLAITDSPSGQTDDTLYFNIPELASDGDDYMEGNGGDDLMYGGLGQDDIIGGNSSLFGLVTEAMRPDGSDIIFGGAGAPARLQRNDFVGLDDTDHGTAEGVGAIPLNNDPSIPLVDRHSRDADFIMGDNANVYRLVVGGASAEALDPLDKFLQYNYDQTSTFENRGTTRIVVRAMRQLDYTLGGADYNGGTYLNGAAVINGLANNGAADLIHGESGDDQIFAMTGSDIVFGESDDDDIVGGYGNDWISGGTGQDGVLGDDGLIFTSRNRGEADTLGGEPLYGVKALKNSDISTKYSNGNVLNETISTPGEIQIALIHVEGELKKSVDILPFSYDPEWIGHDDEFADDMSTTPFADDIIFGGLNSDWLHGGSGDDAISGAEALEHAYVPASYDVNNDPVGFIDLGYEMFSPAIPLTLNPGDTFFLAISNPGDVLAFNKDDLDGQHLNNRFRAGEFALYDEYDPLRRVVIDTNKAFLLHFDEAEGVFRKSGTVPKATGQQTESYPAVNDDGRDAIFGDLGNDWLVGGTGRDDIYGGWGNDLLNADDDQDVDENPDNPANDLNDTPDTHPYFEDRAYGGAGRDVLIGNTGGDRLIDWVGEYNSFLVPYAPFGQASVSRTLQPFMPEYLYALSFADGADPTRYFDSTGSTIVPPPTNNNPNPSRNGEPFAELGVVLQQDFSWGDQTGAPADPQAGNIPGGQRDVLRTAGFNDGTPSGFFVDSGTWSVEQGAYQVGPESLGQDAVSVFLVDQYVPQYFEMLATLNAVKPTGGYKSNAYVIFDYQSETDFKFAGINVSTNKLEMGHRNESGWIIDKQGSVQGSLRSDTNYNVFLSFNGTAVIMIVDNTYSLTFTYAPRVDFFGVSHGLHDGMVGLGANNSKARIDNVTVQRLPPMTTLVKTVDFDGTTTTLFGAPDSGTWALSGGRYAGTPGTTPAMDLVSFNVRTSSLIDLSAKFKVTGEGGFVYDQYALDDFKFVTISAGKITLGHRTSKGWFTDAVINNASIVAGTDYTLGLTLKGTTVNVSLNGSLVVSRTYNAVVTDGAFGLFSRTGTTSFDTVTVKSDDPSLLNQSFALMADTATVATGDAVTALTDDQVAFVARAAVQQWSATLAAGRRSELNNLNFVLVTDLPGDAVAWSIGDGNVLVDMNAAGRGWFVDATPRSSSEFQASGDSLVAAPNSGASGRMDLLSALIHEIGHVIGFEHSDSGAMESALAAGERRQLIDWNTTSTDLRAALGWSSTGEARKPAFPEFSIGMGKAKKKSLLGAPAEEEGAVAADLDWYVEV